MNSYRPAVGLLALLALLLLWACGSSEKEDVDGDPDSEQEEYVCHETNGPDYWGCVPEGFQGAQEGDPCPKEGLLYCLDSSPCAGCSALKCEAVSPKALVWRSYGIIDSGCNNTGCSYYRYDYRPEAAGDYDCEPGN